ncbi:enolase C-terminal domain-like protein [Bacteroidota bacterium]
MLKSVGAFAIGAGMGVLSPVNAGKKTEESPGKTPGNFSKATLNELPKLKITKVKAIATCPEGTELVVVKVETSEPGLYGIGCATFRQRAHPVVSAIDKYLNDFCVGRDVDNIEDLWQSAYQSSYWRNGPVLNNALSGLDQALWDIKGKRANMPVYQLLGGKCRFAVDCYAHGNGSSPEEVADDVSRYMEEGYRHVRIQMGGYGTTSLTKDPDYKSAGFGMKNDRFMDPYVYKKSTRDIFSVVRKRCGERVELLHDMHERLQPMEAISLIESLEDYHPFFIEDPFSPENNRYFKLLRENTSVPIAMGELFNNPHEWVDPMKDMLFDFIRIHISQIGGITPAMKVARLGEAFNVRTAWHGPGDVSPVGHAANAHIDLAVWNFGIQERKVFSDKLREIFPGAPTMENGYMYVNEAPGLGIDINEELAGKYPLPDVQLNSWTQVRGNDGTIIRP